MGHKHQLFGKNFGKGIGKAISSPFKSIGHGAGKAIHSVGKGVGGVYKDVKGLAKDVTGGLKNLTSPVGLITIAAIIGGAAVLAIYLKNRNNAPMAQNFSI